MALKEDPWKRTPEEEAAWQDGCDAAIRTGKYSGSKKVPDCPHPPDSVLSEYWKDGFSEGTDALIAYNDAD